jgi:hypothetical protein
MLIGIIKNYENVTKKNNERNQLWSVMQIKFIEHLHKQNSF